MCNTTLNFTIAPQKTILSSLCCATRWCVSCRITTTCNAATPPPHDQPHWRVSSTQYLFYFAGQSLLPGQDPAPLVARATAALARFDIIGDLSQPHIFAKHLQRHIGTPLPLWRRNVAPVPTEFPANLRPKIETLCAADIAVYQAVQITRIAA